MLAITIAIALTHQCFGAIVFAFHEAIGNARGQKLEKRENFLSPILKSRERFAHVIRSRLVDLLDPGIEFLGRSSNGRRGIPAT